MKRIVTVCVILVLAMAAGLSQGQPQPNPGYQPLSSTGVPDGSHETALVQGAVVHVRINSLETILNDLNDLIVSFVPDKALPPELQPMMGQAKPVLSFLGAQGHLGEPVSAASIARITGFDIRKPVTLTLYPGDGPPVFVLGLDIVEPAVATGFIMNMLAPRAYRRVDAQEGSYYQIDPTKPGMPQHLYAACSAKSVYITNSERMASLLSSATADTRQVKMGFIGKVSQLYATKDVVIACDAAMLRQISQVMLPKLARQVPGKLVSLRSKMLSQMPPGLKRQLDYRARFHAGLSGLDEVLDYAECFANATVEVLLRHIAGFVDDTEGLVITWDIGDKYQTFNLAYFAKTIKPGADLPMEHVKAAIASLPGSRNPILARSRAPLKKKSVLLQDWLNSFRTKVAARNLQLDRIDKIISNIESRRPEQSLESIADWSVTVPVQTMPQHSGKVHSVVDWWEKLNARAKNVPSTLVVMPDTRSGMLENYCRDQVAAMVTNRALEKQMAVEIMEQQPLLIKDARFKQSIMQGGIRRLAIESTMTLPVGFFGYDEHELVNRRLFTYRPVGRNLFILQGQGDPAFLRDPALGTARPVPGSVKRLIDNAPKGTDEIVITRVLQYLPGLIDLLSDLESIAHQEMSGYLQESEKSLRIRPLPRDIRDHLALNMPIMMRTLNLDRKTQTLYATLPGGLVFPRKKIMPSVKKLFDDYVARADELGGGAVYVLTRPGRKEVQVTQSTDALAYVVKSAMNAFYETYIAAPEGRTALRSLFVDPRDRATPLDEVIVVNPFWGPGMR